MPVVRMMLEAAAVAADFWQALGRDDDDAAAALLSSAWEPDASVVNFAANYRAARQIEQATCAVMGTMTHGDLLAADRVRLFHHPVAVSTPLAPFEAITVWRL